MLDRRTLQRLSRESCPILELLNLEILESEAGRSRFDPVGSLWLVTT